MSDADSLQESEGEYDHIKVSKEEWKLGAPLNDEEEDELLDNQQIYTPLRLFVKKKTVNRRSFSATLFERLTFIISYCTTPSKTYFTCWRDNIVHHLIYNIVLFHMFFACLALYFIQSFMGIYASDHHLYITKMVPLTYGLCAMYFFTSILELSRFADLCVVYLDHFTMGILYRFPWHSCSNISGISNKVVTSAGTNHSFQCMSLRNFMSVTKDVPQVIHVPAGIYSCYLSNITRSCNQLTQILYLGQRGPYLQENPMIIFTYFLVIWAACFAWHKQIYRRALFKAQALSQWLFIMVYMAILIQIKIFPQVSPADSKPVYDTDSFERSSLLFSDMSQLFLAVTSFTPPFIHLLSARCKKVKAGTESLSMSLGIMTFILYRVWVETEVHSYVDDLLNGFMVESEAASCFVFPCLYYWLIYFGALTVGNFDSLVFLFVKFVHEYLTMALTLQCLIEIYIAEFKFATRWITSGVIFLCSLIIFMGLYNERHVLAVFCRITILVTECAAIFVLYPLRRLLDDMMFFYGRHPSKYLYLNILLIPVAEFIAVILLVTCVYLDLGGFLYKSIKIFVLLMAITVIPFVAGVIYTVIKYVHISQKEWTHVMCPIKMWGPNNFIARQLRKEFVSKEYIGSQSSRLLSRYLMQNAQPDTYKLDIVYDASLVKPAFSEEFDPKKLQ